ncbi:proline--tRNA ligase [bacterium]|nr:proline--tRNA ligase [candidate division CSSED10-310 bacterium]
MRMSRMVGRRFREKPAEATLVSHQFLLRGGYIRQVARGIYSLLPPARRIVMKIERIIREEMDRIGGQEVLMPMVLPRELWDESGRYQSVGAELARFEDRGGHGMLLGMTHEEAVVHLCRNETTSHRQFPYMVYQIQTKFRDEPRARGGLIRVREFTMKDAYSFHTEQADLEQYYEECRRAYLRIFARCGIPETVVVQSDTGMMGGAVAHEFMLLCEAGEDTVVRCGSCSYLANLEVASARVETCVEPPQPLRKVHTPGTKTIEAVAAFLGVEQRRTAKVIFYDHDGDGKPVIVLIRGDLEVNEAKLARIIQAVPEAATEERAAATGATPGFASPMGIDPARCRIVVDHSIASCGNLVAGANEADHHYRNFNLVRDLPDQVTVDVAMVREGDCCPACGGRLSFARGIEVGNIFQLGDKYTHLMNMRYLDENRNERTPVMGCYGIGVGRLLSSVMEARNDRFGPIWPISIAPWQVQICAVELGTPEVAAAAGKLYEGLTGAGLEVLYDDRDERPGSQFADADLLGVPFRFIVSPRNLAKGVVELKRRGGDSRFMAPEEAAAVVRQAVDEAVADLDRTAARLAGPGCP